GFSMDARLGQRFSGASATKVPCLNFWEGAGQLEVTSVNVVGAMLEMLAAQAPDTWVESQLRTIYAAPGPAPQQRDQLEQRFRIRIVTGYGLSENPFGCVESRTSRNKAHSNGSPGQPAPGAYVDDLRIIKEDGADAV